MDLLAPDKLKMVNPGLHLVIGRFNSGRTHFLCYLASITTCVSWIIIVSDKQHLENWQDIIGTRSNIITVYPETDVESIMKTAAGYPNSTGLIFDGVIPHRNILKSKHFKKLTKLHYVFATCCNSSYLPEKTTIEGVHFTKIYDSISMDYMSYIHSNSCSKNIYENYLYMVEHWKQIEDENQSVLSICNDTIFSTVIPYFNTIKLGSDEWIENCKQKDLEKHG